MSDLSRSKYTVCAWSAVRFCPLRSKPAPRSVRPGAPVLNEASVGGVTMLLPPGVNPIAVTLGSGRVGFLVQPASKTAALATAKESLIETNFMRRREGGTLKQSYWESPGVPQGF